ncbi:MAG: hypothetical protein QNJ45_12550 [Ardenticatenaceae bacterium]|nr:hypothetical protein [Ardenticatenaceae bacterium]
MMLSINNIYGHGYDQTTIAVLRSLGFKIRDQVSTFAGSQILYFIDFAKGPSLEFIEVEHKREYFEFLPRGMVAYAPGINLLISRRSAKDIGDFQDAHRDWGSNLIHVNYDGSDASDRPGWNYLNFDVPVVKDTFIYLSQIDEPKPVTKIATDHPNTAQQVTGLIFDLPQEDLAKLARLAGVEVFRGGFDLGGVGIWSADATNRSVKLAKKQFPLTAIVIEVANSAYFKDREIEGVSCINYLSRPAVHIQTTPQSWDLIMITKAE